MTLIVYKKKQMKKAGKNSDTHIQLVRKAADSVEVESDVINSRKRLTHHLQYCFYLRVGLFLIPPKVNKIV